MLIESEKLVQAAFERVAKGRTTVAVAHRLATIQKADIIYVLGEGKVLEKGNHAELLKMKGVYWHMVRNLLKTFSFPLRTPLRTQLIFFDSYSAATKPSTGDNRVVVNPGFRRTWLLSPILFFSLFVYGKLVIGVQVFQLVHA